jgi:hypothetical protein
MTANITITYSTIYQNILQSDPNYENNPVSQFPERGEKVTSKPKLCITIQKYLCTKTCYEGTKTDDYE